jgi:ABC-2 type transport system ATP-binding protein
MKGADEAGVPAVEVRRLVVPTRDFDVTVSDWAVAAGSCIALIGPNGAGKTTIIEALLGLRHAAPLEGGLLGHSFAAWRRSPRLKRQLGIQLQRIALPSGMLVREVVAFHRRLFPSTAPEIIESLGIGHLSGRAYESLSRGETQRVELFLALAHKPALVFLDEPFTGLDHQYALALSEILRERRQNGGTVVMACHSAMELSLATSAAWIKRGAMARYDSPDALRQSLIGDFRLHASFTHPEAASSFLAKLHDAAQPQFSRSTGAADIAIYGSEALVQLARGLVDDSALEALEFGRTSLADLLYRCAQDDTHA